MPETGDKVSVTLTGTFVAPSSGWQHGAIRYQLSGTEAMTAFLPYDADVKVLAMKKKVAKVGDLISDDNYDRFEIKPATVLKHRDLVAVVETNDYVNLYTNGKTWVFDWPATMFNAYADSRWKVISTKEDSE